MRFQAAQKNVVLPAPGRADDREDLAGRDFNADVAQQRLGNLRATGETLSAQPYRG